MNVNQRSSKVAKRAAAFVSPLLWRGMLDLLLILSGQRKLRREFHTWLSQLMVRLSRSGAKWSSQYMKEMIIMILAVINGQPYEHRPGVPYVAKAASGLPKSIPVRLRVSIIGCLHSSSRHNIVVLRLVLSVLAFSRSLKVGARADLSSIVDPYKGTWTPQDSLAGVKSVCGYFGNVRVRRAWPHLSSSAGPNGRNAVWASQFDAIALFFHPSQMFALGGYTLATGQWYILLWVLIIQLVMLPLWLGLNLIFFGHQRLPSLLGMPIGRLTDLHEGGGKVRIVAAADYWTQWALKGLHNTVFALLRTIPQDGTFNQWKPVEDHVLPLLRQGQGVYSYDLSSATDRLPLFVQEQVLTCLIGWLPAKLWGMLMKRQWSFKGKAVTYRVGQPMGAYSSWAMLALTHHVLVQMAARQSGFTGAWFQSYAIVGDDIVIANDDVAACYYTLLSQHLGVGISLHKSIASKTGLMEFTKRYYHGLNGELSPISPRILAIAVRKPLFLPQLFALCISRGWFASVDQCVVNYLHAATFFRVLPEVITAGVVLLLKPELIKGLSGSPWVKYPEGLLTYSLVYPPVGQVMVHWTKANWASVKWINSAVSTLTCWSSIKALWAWTFDLKVWRQGVATFYYGLLRALGAGFWVHVIRELQSIKRLLSKIPMMANWQVWVWPGPIWCLTMLSKEDNPWYVGGDETTQSVWEPDQSPVQQEGMWLKGVIGAMNRFYALYLEELEYEDDYGRYNGPTALLPSAGRIGSVIFPPTGVAAFDEFNSAHHKACLPRKGPSIRLPAKKGRLRKPVKRS